MNLNNEILAYLYATHAANEQAILLTLNHDIAYEIMVRQHRMIVLHGLMDNTPYLMSLIDKSS
ncbi:MAG: hypothetical protein Tsb005_11400 [Gammaproteobacteria bacterium]